MNANATSNDNNDDEDNNDEQQHHYVMKPVLVYGVSLLQHLYLLVILFSTILKMHVTFEVFGNSNVRKKKRT